MLDDAGGYLEGDEQPPSTEAIRRELVDRVLQLLLADADRADGEVARSDIDRTYLRKGLTIDECCEIEQGLATAGIRVIEDADNDDPNDPAGLSSQSGLRIKDLGFLTEADERELGRKIQIAAQIEAQGRPAITVYERLMLNQGQKARSRLVETNLKYVWKLARELGVRAHLTTEDLFQEGILGLLKATERFDPELGFRFKTYATWWVLQSMHRALDNLDRTVRLPVHVLERYRKCRRTEVRLSAQYGRAATVREVATELGMEVEKLVQLLWRVHATNVAEGDAPIGDDDSLTVASLKADDTTPSAFDSVAHSELRRTVAELLKDLTPREARILSMRFGLDGGPGLTLEAIGQIFQVTRERIRQIEAKAIRKLSHPVRKSRLAHFLD